MVAPFFSFDSSKPEGVLARLPSALKAEFEKASNAAGRSFVNRVQSSFRPRSSPADQWLQGRSGRLRESIGSVTTGNSLDTLRLKVFSAGTKYAQIQESGGTITPKRAKFLAIPLPAVLTAAGVPDFPSARAFIDAHPGQTFFLRTEAGGTEHLLLMWKQAGSKSRKRIGLGNSKAARETAIPVYKLVKKVTIPPRFGFRKAWDALDGEREGQFQRAAKRAVETAIRGGLGG